ncbi:MAG TPA: hypothetical protein VHG27_09820 [Xanthobacteraceae bacterium]|nr:hypothetical protein [Xanthobacteraceae bacterium]
MASASSFTYRIGMEHAQRPKDRGQERHQALETLDRLRDNPTFAGSSLAAGARRAAQHFGGREADEAGAPDKIELWGRRIGRALSLAGCVALGIYLYLTYLR